MKRIKKCAAILTTAIMLLTATAVPTSAITVVRDEKEYIMRTRTPTTGDINVLIIRVGFADYPVDGEDNPADAAQTLLSYFDGSPGSVNAYYESSSYGQLRLHCDKVYSYTAKSKRDAYSAENTDATSSPQGLVSETINALQKEIDVEKYDSDKDGYLDFVCLDYAGPMGDWSTTWWPHVDYAEDLTCAGKRVNAYSFLRGSKALFTHEFGHILGMPDYYAFDKKSTNMMQSFDILSTNKGDHNGFTKWCYGWIGDDKIAYADKVSGDATITLSPVETTAAGKKIAVVAPQINKANGFLDEYFLVEYDSGLGNNAAVFAENNLRPGFRIFHVDARGYFDDETKSAGFRNNNTPLRDNLIHNVKSENESPEESDSFDGLYREGNSLTHATIPNTGMKTEELYNGRFTGISFTNFVTGENPSFKVSFSDASPEQSQPHLKLSYDTLTADMILTLNSDKPLTERRLSGGEDAEKYHPYLLDEKGTKLPLTIAQAPQGSKAIKLSYTHASPTVQPNTAYTLVIPEGCFMFAYEQPVAEYREKLQTPGFFALTSVGNLPEAEDGFTVSNIFAVTANTFGTIKVPNQGKEKGLFIEYNLNAEEINRFLFDMPVTGSADDPIHKCKVFQLNDGNYALEIGTMSANRFVKIDGKGKAVSRVFSVSDSMVQEYTDAVSQIDFDLYKKGLCKTLQKPGAFASARLIIDFENEPTLTKANLPVNSFSIDSDTYIIRDMKKQALLVYNASDQVKFEIAMPSYFLCAGRKNGNIEVIYAVIGEDDSHNVFYADTYDKDGKQLSHRDITANASSLGTDRAFDRMAATPSGYYLIQNSEGSQIVSAYDNDWKLLGTLRFDPSYSLVLTGECGLVQHLQGTDNGKVVNTISRFHIGEFEIVHKKELLLGDANGDGVINILDVTAIQRHLAGFAEKNFQETAADLDGSGLSISDATLLQEYLAEYEIPYAIGNPVA